MRRGDVLRLTDLDGGTCVNLQLHHAALTSERLNPADTVKVQWQAYLGEGALLLSDLGRVLATIIADTSAGHDALCGHTNRRDQRGPVRPRRAPTARTRRPATCWPWPPPAATSAGATSPPGINLFAPVRVGDDGAPRTSQPPTGAPAHVELRAELDLVVLVAVDPHPLDRRGPTRAGPVRITAWAAVRPEPDPFRATTPERLRAFENTEQFVGAARWSGAVSTVDRGRRAARRGGRGPRRRGPAWCAPGETLRIVDLGGNQAVDCLLYNAARPRRAVLGGRHHRRPAQHLPGRRAASCAPTRATR